MTYVSWDRSGFIQRETWDDWPEYKYQNDGWGTCNTQGSRKVICRFGGVGCNVDHFYVKISNLEQRILELENEN